MAYRKDYRKEKENWTAIPKFGGWDKKSDTPDYSMVFSRARANRKFQKSGPRPVSIGNESELLRYGHEDDDDEPVEFKKKKKLLRYFCCIMV